MKEKAAKIPKLPYGEGSMSWIESRQKIMYSKIINDKKIFVYADTPKIAMEKMREKEKKVLSRSKEVDLGLISFGEAISEWHQTFKKPGLSIRNSTYDRENSTIKNQILNYPIAHLQLQAVDERTLQEHINDLIQKPYSYSVVKKTYEVLDQFFKHRFARSPYDNPMLLVKKPTKSTMNVQEKEIEYFNETDLQIFLDEALRTTTNGYPVYPLGRLLVFLCYTGMRVNEMLALKWENVDFENKCVLVKETHARIVDWEKSTDEKKVYIDIFTNTKKNNVRRVFLTQTACSVLTEIYRKGKYTNPTDFIAASKTGALVEERNLRRCLNSIQGKSEMSVQNSGLHVLRHTFCSLMCRMGVDEGVVASLLGQKDREMVQRVYRHISEHEQIDAVRKIDQLTKGILESI